jgi:hypothetical protein
VSAETVRLVTVLIGTGESSGQRTGSWRSAVTPTASTNAAMATGEKCITRLKCYCEGLKLSVEELTILSELREAILPRSR